MFNIFVLLNHNIFGGSTGVETKPRKAKNEWLTNITEWTGMRCEDLVRIAQDREPWRIMTANLLKEDVTWGWWWWNHNNIDKCLTSVACSTLFQCHTRADQCTLLAVETIYCIVNRKPARAILIQRAWVTQRATLVHIRSVHINYRHMHTFEIVCSITLCFCK